MLLEVRNLNAVHHTPLRSIDHMREAFKAVQRGVFDLDIVFQHSTTHKLADIADVFARETAASDSQSSLKTVHSKLHSYMDARSSWVPVAGASATRFGMAKAPTGSPPDAAAALAGSGATCPPW